ncbi:coenzyme A pyrophosphatase [Tersicoccus solisilvae]|uniref:Coenzyme A pyrophosphatase n=1 Tax=Tersicoccus solisilvae TaxID=1882339 RepID=A0ABQ1NR91_9MICC|nr:CoA pyrophosphatase [Tersicoccus solisilvae]GGC80939.1 coenzyme A pyrophosphatase [Tersicoccus solisilvae]
MSAYTDLSALGAAGEALISGRSADPQLGLDPATARAAAVLILFGVLDGRPADAGHAYAPADLDVLLVERSRRLGHHPGQIAFPGGGVDATDASVEAAALREAREETGLDPNGVEVLGTMPEVGVPVSGYRVTPVLAWWATTTPVAVVDRGESERVFRAPVSDLLDPARRVTAVVERGTHRHLSPAFLLGDEEDAGVVWGFTGMLLSGAFDRLGWTVPWDRTRRIPAPL